MTNLFLYAAVYLIPTFIMFYMAVDIFLRNPKRSQHRLLSLFTFAYGMLFLGEFFRNTAPVAMSPAFVTYWFGNAGLLVFSTSLHFIFRVSNLWKKMPRLLYPGIFYLPMAIVLFTYVFQTNVINSQQFDRIGLFIYPEFNPSYLITMTVGNVFHVLVIGLLVYARTHLRDARRGIINVLLGVALIVLVWDVVFGYNSFYGIMPPYAYMYGGLFWAAALTIAMRRFDYLASYQKRFATLYNLNPSAILLVDRYGRIESANPAAYTLLKEQDLLGHPFADYLPEKKQQDWTVHYEVHFQSQRKFNEYETKVVTREQQERYVVMDADFVFIEQELHGMLLIRDIQSFKEAEQTIRFFAYHDPLTKIANRRSFYEAAGQELLKRMSITIVVVDLDGFKGINDTYGHQIGDAFLIHMARLLEQEVASLGFAARVGGDEFFLLLYDQTPDQLHQFMSSLLKTFQDNPFLLAEELIEIRTSIGLSYSPDHGISLDTLIHHADQAMYHIKHNGKNGYRIHDTLDPIQRPYEGGAR
ncbi:sensor domain-containing diguanylate cyclase [Exiguobacterium undae]|uniref:Diguanylate cyclase n=1 Tax=Exiguobacterium undae TaxID=169177 RepID=A0ABX2V6A4_9BACL|nr:sensor domain-containing diguanylate cyclase [Exiguobacterium undae]OAN10250.1 diguanylate cyclase [Exiguobacterium undae]